MTSEGDPAATDRQALADYQAALDLALDELERRRALETRLARENAGLRRALARYGHHLDTCALKFGGFCSCGLSDARRE